MNVVVVSIYSSVQFSPSFEGNFMIMSLKQREIWFEPRMKFNVNIAKLLSHRKPPRHFILAINR